MECEKIIHTSLDNMGFQFETPDQLVESWNKCLKILCQLDEKCSDTLIRIAQNLLECVDQSEPKIEDKLWMVLDAMYYRGQSGILELAVSSLVSEKTQLKEQYVDILDRLEDPLAIPALMYALKFDDSTETLEGWTRSKAIDALLRLRATEAATMVIPYVKDSSDRVRSSAIKFLIRINVPEAAPVFIEQLHEEDDCDNLEYLISGLVLWKQTDSLPLLRNILTSEWMENEEELKIVVNDAISTLEATKYEILSISQSN